jgi:hypothetical protein
MGKASRPLFHNRDLHRSTDWAVDQPAPRIPRRGDEIFIGVNMSDAKTWWRNFLGDGGALTVKLDGRDRAGHAIARRDDQGRVTVMMRLDQI